MILGASCLALIISHSRALALPPVQTIEGWGYNYDGEVGNNTMSNTTLPYSILSPVQVSGLSGLNITGLAGGSYHSLAVSSSGSVYAWGSNAYGQLGSGNTTSLAVPTQVLGVGGTGTLSGITAVSGGQYHTLALSSSGSVYAWGYNSDGELGNNSTTYALTPVPVVGVGGSGTLSGISAVAGGGFHSLALTTGGNVYAWGSNTLGEVGNSTISGGTNTPVLVQGVGGTGNLATITAISGGLYHSVALSSTGSVYAWGYNGYGQLGNGTTNTPSNPVQVVGVGGSGTLSGITAIAAGGFHTLALSSSGSVYAWGYNNDGQLGSGDTNSYTSPLLVNFPANGSAKVVAISAGALTSFARESDGSLWAWGDNTRGEYGNGTTTSSLTPVEVFTPSGGYGVTAFSPGTGGYTSHAIIAPVPEPSLCLAITALGLMGARRLRRAIA